MSVKSDIVKKELAKFPNTPQTTLAKKIYANNKEVFKDLDDARYVVRYYCGKTGEKNRKQLAENQLF